MTDDFDPYYTWLGIPPEEQPADHYRLLGVRRFESNLDVISNAGDQRMAFLRTFQVGKRSAHSQRLLNETAAAKVCLLDHKQRKAYDEKLKAAQPKPVALVPQITAQSAPAYSPPAPVLVPSRQAAVMRTLPVATRLPSPTADPFALADPFADAASQIHSQPVLHAKPRANESCDYSDQMMTMVRAAVSRAQESPLATAAYGVLALGVVMLLGVGLWIGLSQRQRANPVAGVPAVPVADATSTRKQPDNKVSSSLPASNPRVERQPAPSNTGATSLPPTPPASAATVPANPAAADVASNPSPEPPSPTRTTSPPVSPTETAPPPAATPVKIAASPLWNVYPGKFPLPRKARLSTLTNSLAEFAVPSRVLKVWPAPPNFGQKIDDPLTITTLSNVQCVAFSRDDQLLAIGTEKTVDIWDLKPQKHWSVVLPGPAVDIVFCNDDLQVAVACRGDKPLALVSLKTRGIVKKFQSAEPEVRSLASSDQWLAALGSSGQIALYDLRKGIHQGALVHPANTPFTSVYMRGNEVFAFDSQSVTSWGAKELKQFAEWSTVILRSHPQPDDFDVRTGLFTQQENGTLTVFKWAGDEPRGKITAPGGKFAIVDIGLSSLLTSGPDDQLLLWNLDRVKGAARTLDPAAELAAWSGAPAVSGIAGTPSSTVPEPSSATADSGPLEVVDPVQALEALRSLSVPNLPRTAGEVTYLNLGGSRATDADAKYVAAFPQIQALQCERIPITGRALRYFQKLPQLKSISLSGTKIGDDDLTLLGTFTNLESLMLGDTAVTTAGVVHLKGLTKLHTLILPHNLGRDLVPIISGMEQLRTISPFPPRMDDQDLAQLSKLTHLHSLDLQQANLTLRGYKQLESFQEASSVSLFYDCPREALASLKNMKLQYFNFPRSARDADVALFATMPTLKAIYLNEAMTDKAVAALAKISNLEQVGLHPCKQIRDGGLAPLRELKSLRDLTLPEGAGDEGLRIVAQIPTLQQLHLSFNGPITDDGIEALGALSKLITVSLPNNTSDRSCETLSKLKDIQVLQVHGKKITASGLRKLSSLEKLSHLSIHKPLSANDVAALKTLKSARSIWLHGSGLSEEVVADLAQALPGVDVRAYK